jgi:hypothetical protein
MTFKRSYTDEQLIEAVKNSKSYREMGRALGLKGRSFRAVKHHIQRLGLDTAHFIGQSHSRGIPRTSKTSLPLEMILVENSTYFRSDALKARLFKEGKLDEECIGCGLGPEWQGKSLTLQLDHINGVSNDNRIENLQILCPNCHTQTSTYAGRNQQRPPPEPMWKCMGCGKKTRKGVELCVVCYAGQNGRKINIDEEQMIEDLKTKTVRVVAGNLGIDATTINRRLKRLGLTIAVIRHPERSSLSDDQVSEIRTRFWRDDVRNYETLATEYKTTIEIVGRIIRRDTWPKLPFIEGELSSTELVATRRANNKPMLTDEQLETMTDKYETGNFSFQQIGEEYGCSGAKACKEVNKIKRRRLDRA